MNSFKLLGTTFVKTDFGTSYTIFTPKNDLFLRIEEDWFQDLGDSLHREIYHLHLKSLLWTNKGFIADYWTGYDFYRNHPCIEKGSITISNKKLAKRKIEKLSNNEILKLKKILLMQ